MGARGAMSRFVRKECLDNISKNSLSISVDKVVLFYTAIYPLNPPVQYFTTSVSQTPIVYFVVTHFGICTIYEVKS